MATPAELAAHLAAVESALYKGESSVTFGDRTTHYRNIAELRELQRELLSTINARPRQTLIVASKGW